MQDYIHFHITDLNLSWHYLFSTMEKLKLEMPVSVIEDYSVSETTLEQVFLSFAKHQRPESDKEAAEAAEAAAARAEASVEDGTNSEVEITRL